MISEMLLKQHLSNDSKLNYRFGLVAGAPASLSWGHFGLQPALLFSQKGFRYVTHVEYRSTLYHRQTYFFSIMALSNLWQRLFTSNDQATEVALHVAGATSRSHHPFEQLATYRNQEELSKEYIDKWVMKFYMVSIARLDAQSFAAFVEAAREVTPDIVRQLLGDFNWRPRIVGAYFAAIKGYEELTDIMGVHLLQSEVCYAGAGYALAFAMFRSDRAQDYLKAYLDYYLQQPDLWYDQADALAALHLLDPVEAATYSASWQSYVVNKPNHRLEDTIYWLRKRTETVEKIRAASLA